MATYDVFLSHSYGPAHAHHNQVAQIAQELQALQSPKTPWLDDTNLPYAADLEKTFETAIDSSRCFFLFLTREYQDKVFDESPFNWCRYEYRAAINMNKQILVILLDPALQDPRTSWCRSLQIRLADRLYFDMSDSNIFANPQLLREKCILLGRILDELQNHGNMAKAINRVFPHEDHCPTHDEHYEYYDTVLNQVICRHCATTTNEGNAKVTIVAKAKQIRENDFSAIHQRLTKIINNYKENAAELIERRKNDLQLSDSYQQQFHDLFQQMRFAITETENAVIAFIQDQQSHKQKTVDQLRTRTSDNQQQVQDLINNLNHPATNVSFVRTWIQAKEFVPENIKITSPINMALFPNLLSSSLEDFHLIQKRIKDGWIILSQSIEIISPDPNSNRDPFDGFRLKMKINPTLSLSYSYCFIFKFEPTSMKVSELGFIENVLVSSRRASSKSDDNPIASFSMSPSNYRVFISVSFCNSSIKIRSDGEVTSIPKTLQENQYFQVCWTVQDEVMKLYLDGLQIAEISKPSYWTRKPIELMCDGLQIRRLIRWDQSLTSNEVQSVSHSEIK